jgi:hypothetical protein
MGVPAGPEVAAFGTLQHKTTRKTCLFHKRSPLIVAVVGEALCQDLELAGVTTIL